MANHRCTCSLANMVYPARPFTQYVAIRRIALPNQQTRNGEWMNGIARSNIATESAVHSQA